MLLELRPSETMVKSSFWKSFKIYMYIYFLKAYEKAIKAECLNFVSGYSFPYVSQLNLVNFDELSTDHFCIDRQINNIYRIYIQFSLICNQSQLSSSIRSKMTDWQRWKGQKQFFEVEWLLSDMCLKFNFFENQRYFLAIMGPILLKMAFNELSKAIFGF